MFSTSILKECQCYYAPNNSLAWGYKLGQTNITRKSDDRQKMADKSVLFSFGYFRKKMDRDVEKEI